MIALDDIDRRIVNALQADGRLPMVELAERVGLSATPCQRRVKRLEEEGVIGRYAALVSPLSLGLALQALVQVTLDDHSEKTVEAYKEINNDKTDTKTLIDLVKTPSMSDWNLYPQGTMKFAEHLNRIGTLKTMPKSFKDYYLPTVHGMPGN